MDAISINPTRQMPNMFSTKAIDHLILRHRASMYKKAIYLCRNSDQAEDLVQETLFHGIKYLYQLKDHSKSKLWMLTILKNQYFKIYSQAKKLERWGKEERDEYMSDENIPEKTFLENELDQNIRFNVEKLSDRLKVPLKLFYFHHMSYKEISEKLVIPIGTVMSRIARAKSNLKEKFLEN